MIDRERLTNYPRLFAFLYVVLGGWWLLSGEGLLDRSGKNVGVDFVTFWAASAMALRGTPEQTWDVAAMAVVERAAVGVPTLEPYAFHYPPTFVLLLTPIALLPYLPAFFAWVAAGTAAFVPLMRRVVPDPVTTGLALSFPGFFQNVLQGQNGLFTTSLLGGSLWFLRTRPVLSGVLLGLLTFKPQLAACAFLGLLVSRAWVALGSALLTAALFAGASVAAFGLDPWRAFLANAPFAVRVLESEGVLPWTRMPTVQVAAMLLGAPIAAARAAQAVATLAAFVSVAWAWARPRTMAARVCVVVGAVFLSTPFAFDYDTALLALPAAWLGRDLLAGEGRRGDGWLVAACWLAPLAVPAIATGTGLQLGPALSAALVVRGLRDAR